MRYFVLYLVCALVLSSKSTLAQDNSWSITLSKEAIVSQDQGIPRILFAEQRAECYFVLREQIYRNFKRRKFFIERLDFALKSLQTKDITEQLDEQNFEIQEVLKLDDRLLLLSTSYLKEEKMRAFYFQELLYDTLEIKPRVEIYRLDSEANAPYHVELIQSPDSTKIMFSVIPDKRIPLIKKAENDFRDIVVLNRDLTDFKRLGRLEMRTEKMDYFVDQSMINNDGVLYFKGIKIPDKKSEEPDYYLLRYQNGKLEASRLNFSSGQIKNARIDFTNEGKVLYTGYFYETKRFNPGVGFFAAAFNQQTLETELINSEIIKNEVLMSGMSDRQKKRWTREIEAGRDLKINNEIIPLYFFRHPGGDVSVIGEIQYVSIETSGFTQAGTLQRLTYNYEHIFIARMNAVGKILWITKIPKLYRGNIDLQQSFHALQSGEKIEIIFNDNIANQFPNPRKGIGYLSSRSKQNFVVNYQIDEKGNSKNNPIFEYKNEPYNKISMLSMYSDVAATSKEELLFTTSGKLGHYYLLMKK